MERTSRKYTYFYTNNHARYHHTYLAVPLLRMMAEVKPVSEFKPRVLDLGCGNGSLSNLIAQQGYEVVGLDNSIQGIAIARNSFPNCHFIEGDIYELPNPDLAESFDIVLAVEVIEHLFYPKELAKAAKKCLKPDGYLILTTPYHGYLKNLFLAISGKMDKHFTVLWDNGHIKFFSVATLTTLLKMEGFTELNFEFAGRLPYIWKSMLCSSKKS